MALGSAIHKRSSCTHTPIFSVKTPDASHQGVFVEGETYPKRTVPTNDVPKSLKEPPLCSSSFLGLKIPLVSLKVFTLSAICHRREVRGARSTHWGHTEDPRWVHRSWDIPDRGKLPTSSEKSVCKDCCASCECSELIPHGFVVRVFATEQS